MLAALDAERVPAVAVQMRGAAAQRRAPGLRTVSPAAAPFGVNLFYVNGDGMRSFLRRHGHGPFDGRYSIGMWWWEVIPAPDRWAAASTILDEIWVCSDHVRDAIVPVAEVPVLKMQLPVPFPAPSTETRQSLDLPEGFLFYTTFDYSSTFGRKNPVGVVEAFRRAFREGSGAQLVIRSINGRRDPHSQRLLHRVAAGRRDIRIVDRYLEPAQKNAMLAQCDCYVSLHRAEGFGHSLAEAMRLGKPVIATGWSGNLEYMTEANSYLVGYTMTHVGHGSWPYPPESLWAEPDLDHAAELMRGVFDDPASAAMLGALAAREIARRHDPGTVGAAIGARLREIHDRDLTVSINTRPRP